MSINDQLMNYDLTRNGLAESSVRWRKQVQAEWEDDPLRWQTPLDHLPEGLEEIPGNGHYVNHPGIFGLFSLEQTEIYLRPAKQMWELMEAAHDCWVKDDNRNALKMQMILGIDPDAPNRASPAHVEEGFEPLEVLDLKWLAPALPMYTNNQWEHLVVVWTKVHTLTEEVATFRASTRELTTAEERLRYWIAATLQVMKDRRMPAMKK